MLHISEILNIYFQTKLPLGPVVGEERGKVFRTKKAEFYYILFFQHRHNII